MQSSGPPARSAVLREDYMKVRHVLWYGLLLAAGLTTTTALTFGRPITFDDLYRVPRASDPQIAPDSRTILYVVRTSEPKANKQESHVWLMNADGTQSRQLTFGPSSEWQPRWSPDGKGLYFLTDRQRGAQVWYLPLSGGEASRVTDLAMSVSDFQLFPNGTELLAISRVYPDCDNDSCNSAEMDKAKNSPVQARLYDHLLFRHYSQWADGKVARPFVGNVANRSHRPLLKNTIDIPPSTLGGEGDIAIAPDGGLVCFSRCVSPEPAVLVNNDLFELPAGGGEPHAIAKEEGLEGSPRYSPDGRWLSYCLAPTPGYESDDRFLMLRDRTTGVTTNLTSGFDGSVGEYVWDPKGRFIYFASLKRGFTAILRLDIRSHALETVLDGAVFNSLRISPDGSYLVLSRSTSTEPHDLYRFDLARRRLSRLTDIAGRSLDGIDLIRAEQFWFAGSNGDSVHGFLTKPVGFDPQQKYPLVLLIHGGPQWCWLGDFNYYGWNTNLMAAQGYLVAQINPHGSLGYGRKFKEAVSGNWGKGDYEDLMTGIDYLLRTYRYIDSTRLGALGRSYGGFMTNWICGHTNRFACLVTVDGTVDHLSDYGATDELWFPEWEYRGTPWSNTAEYLRTSPIMYAQNFHTPTLVVHGQKDYRVDLSAGLQMFTALQRMGVPSQFLYFPDEGHGVSKTENLRVFYDTQLAWLARWLNP
jgi:dipeptidyl aminopeptidase/acylaminoacyl peptidase